MLKSRMSFRSLGPSYPYRLIAMFLPRPGPQNFSIINSKSTGYVEHLVLNPGPIKGGSSRYIVPGPGSYGGAL